MSTAPLLSDGRHLGDKLRGLRLRKGRSLRQVAERSGIGRSTLSRWENGRTPADPETLEPLLSALNLGPQDRREISALLPTPPQPDLQAAARRRLFRAVRMRNRLSLSQAGGKIGVAKATLSRWETGERWPGRARLAQAAQRLGATPSEVAAIQSPGPLTDGAVQEEAALRDRVYDLRNAIPLGASDTLDAEFLGLDAEISRDSSPDARRLRLELRAAYVEWLGWWYRDAEAGMHAARLLPALRKEPESRVWGRVLRACANYAREFKSDPGAAIELLSGACKTLEGGPSEGFVRRELSGLYLSVGDPNAAWEELRRAFDATAAEEDPDVHAYCCRMIEAELWSAAGRHDRAQESLPTTFVRDPYLGNASAVGKAQILVRAGNVAQAKRVIQEALEMAERCGLPHFQAGLRRRLVELGPE